MHRVFIKIFWTVIIALIVAGLGWFSFYSIQPKAIRKIKISVFETPQAVSNSIWLRLQEDFKKKPVWIVGADPESPDQLAALSIFLNGGPDPTTAFDEIWLDTSTGFELSTALRKVVVRGNEEALKADLEKKISENKRVLIVTLPVYAATILSGNPAWKLSQAPALPFYSLVFAELPRNADQEANLRIPCVLPHNDKFGTGSLGCWIIQRAKLNYRKKLETGALVGMMDQISSYDFLFLLGREP